VVAPTRPTRQAAGGTPLGLALLLERSGVRLEAPAQALAPGLELQELVLSFPGPRPATAASCRERRCAIDRLRLRVAPDAALVWLRGRLEGARLPGWRVEHVAWDMLEGTGDPWAWTLRGAADSGGVVWLRVELQAGAARGRLVVGARRCWLLGPPELDGGRSWRALLRRIGRGPGLMVEEGALMIEVARASVGPALAAAGWRLPGRAGLAVGLTVARAAVLLGLGEGPGTRWPAGQVATADPEDPLAGVRVGLRGGATARARADASLQALAAAHPAVAGPLLRARALALRFVARERCVAALHEWLRVAPEDAEARWLLTVQHASLGETAALIEALRAGGAGVRQRLALALALQRAEGGAAEARAQLEALVERLPGCEATLQAAVWRALARSRAADRATPATAVLAAVSAALGEEGWRRRDEAGELRAQVAAALVGSGRPEADTAPLLRRLLGDVGPGRWDRGPGPAARRERGEARASARIVSEYLAQEGRWSELVAVLERQLVRLGGAARIQALLRIARIHRHYLHDPARAEQALRVALAQPVEDEATGRARLAARAELVTCLELEGRLAEAAQGVEGEGAVVGEDGPGDRFEDEGAVVGEDVPGDRFEGVGAVVGEDVPGDRVEDETVVGEDGPGDRLEDAASRALEGREALARALEGALRGEPEQVEGLRGAAAGLLALGGAAEEDRAWLRLAAFLQGRELEASAWPSTPGEIWAPEPGTEPEPRAALRAGLRRLAGALAGIRASEAPGPAGVQEARGLAVAEAEIAPLRAALGLELPLRAGGGAAEGGVGVRNERPPAIGVGAALVELGAAERRFRLAFAAVMIAGGLAIVTDPRGASLPELLAALHHLADATCPLRLPGAQAIVRALAARGCTGEGLPPTLVQELVFWQESRGRVARLAQLLRRDSLRAALRLSGALDGALRTIARDARLPPDPQGALRVLASADGQALLRAAGLLA